ncbi:tetratricopeptide repeat protein [Algoriphagus hitonicola]|uniref:Tetratricopeptide repeat-containing protein n=1 Tax=Algoriphagus hitonicola TaxID=435880 RepID=A0A1I2NGA9_9BACT|nr:tetratricopeptide repeat protein [Algoriphagus hitonicola]SFG02070.1 Tetratricopeptide repeat-containing protein [Algoriphagus hitonicola]
MKSVITLLVLVMTLHMSYGQETNDSIPKLDSKTKRILNIEDQAAYQLAMRYNDPGMAKTKLYNLIIRNPENLRFQEALGSLYFEMGESTSAALVALDILEVNDKSIGALEIAAYSLEQVGALDRALPHFESLYLLTGDNFSLYKSGFLQYSLKRYEEAMNSANLLVREAKADEKIGFPKTQTETQEVLMKAAALNLKGMIYLEQGSKEDAKVAFEEAIQLDPSFDMAKENLQKTQ